MARKLKNVNIEIGARIKSERTAQKMTREDLAKLSGYSANFIQEVERGRSGLSSESIRSFAVALNLSSLTWFALSSLNGVSLLHSTRRLQTLSFLFAQLIVPYRRML